MPFPKPDWTRAPLLHDAARRGDVAAIEALLARGADVNARWNIGLDPGAYPNEATPLMVAAGSADGASAETVRLLLERGADPRAVSHWGSAAAMAAWGRLGYGYEVGGDAARLRLLLDAGCDPNEIIWNKRSLLALAAEAGDPERVKLLLERGARPEPEISPSTDTRTEGRPGSPGSFTNPLFEAAQAGSAACIRLLVAAGANPNCRDNLLSTPLMEASTREAVEALLAAGVDLHAVNEFGGDALDEIFDAGSDGESLSNDQKEAARALLRAGANPARVDGKGWSRLSHAAFRRNPDAVTILLEAGASAREDRSHGATPLHWVAWQGDSSRDAPNRNAARVIEILVSHGNPVDSLDPKGRTPLHEAVGGDWGAPTTAETLLRLGAAHDPVDSEGVTPLMLAVDETELECVRLLLAAGADPNRHDADGSTAVHRAEQNLEDWKSIVAEAVIPIPPDLIPDAEKHRASHAQALREAEECLTLLKGSSSEPGEARSPTAPPL